MGIFAWMLAAVKLYMNELETSKSSASSRLSRSHRLMGDEEQALVDPGISPAPAGTLSDNADQDSSMHSLGRESRSKRDNIHHSSGGRREKQVQRSGRSERALGKSRSRSRSQRRSDSGPRFRQRSGSRSKGRSRYSSGDSSESEDYGRPRRTRSSRPDRESTGIDCNVHFCELQRSPSVGLSRCHGMFAPDSGFSDVAGKLA